MNLRVDLILEEEQRSTNLLNVKVLTRLAYIIVPALLVFVILLMSLNAWRVSASLSQYESQWADLEPKQKAVKEMKVGLIDIEDRLRDLEGWRKARMDLADKMDVFIGATPAKVQLQNLNYNANLELLDLKWVARHYRLKVSGSAIGVEAQANVESLQAALLRSDAYLKDLNPETKDKDVRVSKFQQDPDPLAKPTDRVFDIECDHKARTFE